jgi:hypothetical protein
LSNLKLLWEFQDLEQKKLILEKQLKSLPEFKDLKMLKKDIEVSQEEIRGLN